MDVFDNYISQGWLRKQCHPCLPLCIWNYTDKTQWEGKWDEITLTHRGLVKDRKGNIVARPFSKFFNLSEGRTNVTDEYEVFEKLDGSLGILFHYAGDWILCTKGSFISEQAQVGKVLLNKICDYSKLNKKYTYCFEIIYSQNKIVVEYEGLRTLILTAVIETETGLEKDLYGWGLPVVRTFGKLDKLEVLKDHIKDNEEGYVVKFSNGERCKVKGAEYLRLHKLMSEMSTTRVWECLSAGNNILDILKDFPDEFYQTVLECQVDLISKYNVKILDIIEKFNTFDKNISDKEFAMLVKDEQNKHYFFALRNGKEIKDQIWRELKPEYRRL